MFELLSELMTFFQLTLQLRYVVCETKDLHCTVFLVALEFCSERLILTLKLCLVVHQVLVCALQCVEACNEVLDLRVVVTRVLYLFKELLKFHVTHDFFLELCALFLAFLELQLQLFNVFLTLPDLSLLLCSSCLSAAPLRLIILEELVEANELMLQLQILGAELVLLLLELFLVLCKTCLLIL